MHRQGWYYKSGNTVTFLDLIDRYKDGLIIPAAWQRDDIWDNLKKEEFKETILCAETSQITLEGTVIIYDLYEDVHRIPCKEGLFSPDKITVPKVNDGMQRIYTGEQIYENMLGAHPSPEKIRDINKLFKRINVLLQHMIYVTEEDAMLGFLRVNYGTGMTSFEKCNTIIRSRLTPTSKWESFFCRLNANFASASGRMGIGVFEGRGVGRADLHRHLRDNMALFLRFCTNDKTTSNYRSSATVDLPNFRDESLRASLLESKLCDYLEKVGYMEANQQLTAFVKFIERETAFIEDVWKRIDKSSWINDEDDDNEENNKIYETLTMANFRWALCVAIFRHNNGIPIPRYEKFLKLYFEYTRGASQFVKKNIRKTFQVQLSNLQRLAEVQKTIGYGMDESIVVIPRRTHRNNEQVKSGKSAAHDPATPYSICDEGRVSSEPTLRNLSDGTRNTSVPIGEPDDDKNDDKPTDELNGEENDGRP